MRCRKVKSERSSEPTQARRTSRLRDMVVRPAPIFSARGETDVLPKPARSERVVNCGAEKA